MNRVIDLESPLCGLGEWEPEVLWRAMVYCKPGETALGCKTIGVWRTEGEAFENCARDGDTGVIVIETTLTEVIGIAKRRGCSRIELRNGKGEPLKEWPV